MNGSEEDNDLTFRNGLSSCTNPIEFHNDISGDNLIIEEDLFAEDQWKERTFANDLQMCAGRRVEFG